MLPLKKYYHAKCKILQNWKVFLKELKEQWLPYYIDEIVKAKVPNFLPKKWITKILSMNVEGDCVFFDLQILTWRTHQIRCHLSNHGLPIISDYLYWEEVKWVPLQLSAYKLEYLDPCWKIKVVEI